MQFKDKFSGIIIEVDEFDAGWFKDHENLEAVNVEAEETIETKPRQQAQEVLKRGPGRPRQRS